MSNVNPKNFKILLVDDFEIVRLMLKNALSDLGFPNVEEAEDGRVALKLIREAHSAGAPFNLVFCDWNMPDVSGLDVLETCRSLPDFKNLPIVMVTAEAEQQHVVRALRAGATDYVVKPIAPDVLEKKVNKVLSKLAGKVV